MLGTRSISLSCQISEKNYFRKRPISSEGARAISVYFSDPSQTVEPLDSVGVDLDYPRPDLSICEVKNQKKLKTLAGQFFQWGVM